MPDKIIKEAASAAPDPQRSLKNLQAFCVQNPGYTGQLISNILPVSMLFSFSQFLATSSLSAPDDLFEAIDDMDKPIEKEAVRKSLKMKTGETATQPMEILMSVIRVFNRKMLLLITLRDIMNRVDIAESMFELSILAEAVISESLLIIGEKMRGTYGDPSDDAFSVIAAGKLGGSELNFRSDVDLLYIYGQEHGWTSGILKPHGIVANRISNHEYYCKLGEGLGRFLSANTEDGFAYRVDMKLRPEGRKGSLAMSLNAYELYYESWGRAWERAVLLRARPVAGDAGLGTSFIEMIKAFVYRKYLDFSAIDEIRKMKTRIDATFKRDDIKRGCGGIREIEFFVQALQLIYGGREPVLQERNVMRGLHLLLQKNLVGHEDYSTLSGNYLFLRRLEHRLQQFNGLQTHSVPADKEGIIALSKKMGFMTKTSFLSELEKRRRATHQIYGSLFAEKGQAYLEAPLSGKDTETDMTFFLAEETTESELRNELGKHHLMDIEKALRNIHHIRDSTFSFQTLRGRSLLSGMLPSFLSEALKSKNPDAALNNLQSFALLLASEGPYLELISKNAPLIPLLTRIFSISEYLSKGIMKRHEYLEMLGLDLFIKKTLQTLKRELLKILETGKAISDSIRIFHRTEEIRLGMLFLDKKIDAVRLMKSLSRVAEAVLSVCAEEIPADKKPGVIGMGKAGGRELTFSSDLDLIFVCEGDVTDKHVKAAEGMIRLLTAYTKDGIAYNLDMRLRPDGTKGPIVCAVSSLKNYYLKSARPWEIQSLLKARPLSGSDAFRSGFALIRKEILEEKGAWVLSQDIKSMRDRIRKELSRDQESQKGSPYPADDKGIYDLKLGAGGLEELEFTVQYLQLKNARKHPKVTVQGTLEAINRLGRQGMINEKERVAMRDTYIFYRTLESLMRLTGEAVIREDSIAVLPMSEFMGFRETGSFLADLKEKRLAVREMFETFLA